MVWPAGRPQNAGPHRMNGMDFENLRTARTARTYPVEAARLARTVAEATRGLEGCEPSR